ncbi:Hsp70 family protein [Leadbettera azotonutricia]|uniref:2-hexadecenal reductase n=1 Tax=Leadbettera azotonutricia (strain ATCC BAA-888 / DSM 13862 / ZAS-9) TaxID=545695 RepID=F5Y7K2_LEAAZ|nr:Hsp70 family protein [Leadbettera azotonutricia]AEF83295.1 2-hexadecenal reductase [Leadbettera azotonutricia ZAS-9]
MATYGIDLGTTYSAISTLDDNGKPVIIENQIEGKPTLASAVYFPADESDTPVIGDIAKNSSELEGDRVIQFIKRDIGKADGRTFNFGGIKYNPITLSSLILKRLSEYAKEQGHDVHDVVITCPAYFGIEERNATRQAGEVAGFNVLSIINEPTAAALNYCAREFKENRTIMVYDLGGGTFDVSILKMSVDNNDAANIDIIATDGNDRLGGKDWDDRLFQHLLIAYCNENGTTPEDSDVGLKQAIRSNVEGIKKKLSQLASTKATISYNGDTTKLEVTQEQFNDMTKDLVAQTTGFIDSILGKSKLSEQDIDIVLLVGGSTFMPMVFNTISERFPNKVRREDPDLAVAKGAALYAAMKVNEQLLAENPNAGSAGDKSGVLPLIGKPMKVNDKAPRSFGPGVMFDNEYKVDNLILIGEDSPVEATGNYATMADNQQEILIRVFENSSDDPNNRQLVPCVDSEGNEQYTDPALKMKKIGELTLGLPTHTPKNSPIEVTFKLDPSGLFVKAVNSKTGDTVETSLISDNTLTEEELKKATTALAAITTTSEA